MKANELRLGNWVLAEGNPYKIKHISPDDEWEPIKLSPEILVKCNGNKIGDDAFDFGVFYIKPLRTITQGRITGKWEVLLNGSVPYSIRESYKYLHQLQNLYSALTGEELEINLT